MATIMVRPGQKNSVARTTLAMIMMVDAALGQLKDLGYERGFDDVDITENEEGFVTVLLGGRKVFEIVLNVDPDKGVSFDGVWSNQPPKKSLLWLRRAYRWVIRKLTHG